MNFLKTALLFGSLALVSSALSFHDPQRCFEIYDGQQVYATAKDQLGVISYIDEPVCRERCVRTEGCKAYTYWTQPTKRCILSRSTVCQQGESYAISGVIRRDCSQLVTSRKVVYIPDSFPAFQTRIQPAHQRCFELHRGQRIFATAGDELKVLEYVEEPECRRECVGVAECNAYTYWKYPKRNCVLTRSTKYQPGDELAISGIIRSDCSRLSSTREVVYISDTYPRLHESRILPQLQPVRHIEIQRCFEMHKGHRIAVTGADRLRVIEYIDEPTCRQECVGYAECAAYTYLTYPKRNCILSRSSSRAYFNSESYAISGIIRSDCSQLGSSSQLVYISDPSYSGARFISQPDTSLPLRHQPCFELFEGQRVYTSRKDQLQVVYSVDELECRNQCLSFQGCLSYSFQRGQQQNCILSRSTECRPADAYTNSGVIRTDCARLGTQRKVVYISDSRYGLGEARLISQPDTSLPLRHQPCFELFEGQQVYIRRNDQLKVFYSADELECRNQCVGFQGCMSYTFRREQQRNCILSRSVECRPGDSYTNSGVIRTDCARLSTGRKVVYISDSSYPLRGSHLVSHPDTSLPVRHQRCFELFEGQQVYISRNDELKVFYSADELECRNKCVGFQGCMSYTFRREQQRNCILSRSVECRPADSYTNSGVIRTDCARLSAGRKVVYISDSSYPVRGAHLVSQPDTSLPLRHQRCFELFEGQQVYISRNDELKVFYSADELECRNQCVGFQGCMSYTYRREQQRNCVLSRSVECRPADSYTTSGIMRMDCARLATQRKVVYIPDSSYPLHGSRLISRPDSVLQHQRCFELFEGYRVYTSGSDQLKVLYSDDELTCRNQCVGFQGCLSYTFQRGQPQNCILSRSVECRRADSYTSSGVIRMDCARLNTQRKVVYISESPYFTGLKPKEIYTRVVDPATIEATRFSKLINPVLPGESVVLESLPRRVYVPKLNPNAVCVDRYENSVNTGVRVLAKKSLREEEECVRECNEHDFCSAYSFFPSNPHLNCWFHNAFTGEMAFQKGTISGSLRNCKRPYQPMLIHSSRNYNVLPEFLGLGFSADFAGGKYCWEMCRASSLCRSVSYSARSNVCHLRSAAPSLHTQSAEPGAAVAVKLTGQFNFFPATNLPSVHHSEFNVLERKAMVFNVFDCERACLSRDGCNAYLYSLHEAKCHLLGGYIDDMDMVGNQHNFALGVRDGARLCWRQFHGQRNPSMSFFLRLLNNIPDPASCRRECKVFPGCKAFTFYRGDNNLGRCALKSKMDDQMTLLDTSALSAALVHCPNRHADLHVVSGFKFENQPEVYKVADAEEFNDCSNLCANEAECASYFFHPRTCYLMSSVPQGMFRANNAHFGVKLTGQFRAYKWRRFEMTPEMEAVRLEGVGSGRGCEEECLQRSCQAYVFNFHTLHCYILPHPVPEHKMITDGFSIAGFRHSAPLLPLPEQRLLKVRTVYQ